jgi:hypothetical protein
MYYTDRQEELRMSDDPTMPRPTSDCSADALYRENLKQAHTRWGVVRRSNASKTLARYSTEFRLSISLGDLLLVDNRWYVTHSGLARRSRCAGIQVKPVTEFSDPSQQRWAFKATVYKSRACMGFVGYGDADPSNVSALVRGAEMRVAETRAVNRALRKAYGIGICSVEEIGPEGRSAELAKSAKKLPSQSVDGNGWRTEPKLRDRLCQLIRQHQLDAVLVKSYAVDFCGTKTLREASREQVEHFVNHLADWAAKDKNALVCQLNSYVRPTEGAA